MRFLELQLTHFGVLTKDGERAFELGPVNVVCGPNEAGKSTFAAALETLLFGFDPATRESHPLWKWDEASNLDLAGLLVDRDGARTGVQRVLQSSQRLFLSAADGALADVVFDRKHHKGGLPHVHGVQRKLYRALWNLELGDFQAFDEAVQKDIDNLILPSVEGLELRPTRQVVAELDAAAKGLWRDDRRGQTTTRQLRSQLKDLQVEIRETDQRVEGLRAALDRRPAVDAQLVEVEAELHKLAAAERRAEAAREVAAWCARAAQLGLTPAQAECLGLQIDSPQAALDQRADVAERAEAPRERLRRAEVLAAPADVALLARASEWRAAVAEAGELERAVAARTERERDGAVALAGIARELGKLQGSEPAADWDAPALAWLRGLSLDGLEAGLGTWRAARAQPVVAQRGLRLVLVAAVLLVAALFVPQPWNLLPGVLGLALLGVEFWQRLAPRTELANEAPMPAALEAALAGQVDGAFLTPEGLERLLVRLGPLGERFDGLCEQRARLAAERAEQVATLERLAALAGAELGFEQLGAWRAQVEARLEAARSAAAAVERDAEERRAAAERVAEADAELARLDARLERIAEQLAPFLDPAAGGADGLRAAHAAWRTAREDWIALREARKGLDARLESSGLTFDALVDEGPRGDGAAEAEAEAAAQRAGARARLEEQRTALLEERGELGQRLKGLADEDGVAALMDTERELEEQLSAVRREHDRLRLLEQLLLAADRAWRAEHEPDVLKKAGEHLHAFTGGRYRRLATDEERGGLEVEDAAGERRSVGAPLSRGTRDQIHLALRLALIDHLDENGERLPLVLDEVLVHWDAARRAAIYAALQTVAETRQVFLMTCHESFANEAAAAFGIEPLSL